MIKLSRFAICAVISLALIPKTNISAQSLENANSWSYWLQDIELDQLQRAPYALNVIDYSKDGDQASAFTSQEIDQLKSASQPSKIVVSYLSIGEAEEGRFYFKKSWVKKGKPTSRAPEFLIAKNPDFPDNYKVRYWLPEWQRLIFGIKSGARKSYLDRIIDANFDGVYLDIIDAFENGAIVKERGRNRAAKEMAQFVIKLAEYARNTRGKTNFIVIPQNGATIINLLPANLRTKYLQTIDAIGVEDTFFFGDKDEDNELDPQEDVISALGSFISAGRRVYSIDYLLDPQKVGQFKQLACQNLYVPQVSRRDLDVLTLHGIADCN